MGLIEYFPICTWFRPEGVSDGLRLTAIFYTVPNLTYVTLHSAGTDDVVGPEGMEKFCEDIGVEPENVSLPSRTAMCSSLPSFVFSQVRQ